MFERDNRLPSRRAAEANCSFQSPFPATDLRRKEERAEGKWRRVRVRNRQEESVLTMKKMKTGTESREKERKVKRLRVRIQMGPSV